MPSRQIATRHRRRRTTWRPITRTPAGIQLDHAALHEAARWATARDVRVAPVPDLFDDDVPDDVIEAVFGAMQEARLHTFHVPTIHSGRMSTYLRTHAGRTATHISVEIAGVPKPEGEA
jgi:protein gp37